MLYKSALFCAALLSAASAHAITIDEQVVGDFGFDSDPNQITDSVGLLDFGANSISGAITADCVDQLTEIICVEGPDEGDAFRLMVGAGQAILSITLTTLGTAPEGYTPSYAMLDALTLNFVHTDSLTDFNATRSIIDGVPLGEGEYIFGLGQGLAQAVGTAAYDWRLDIDVGAAPAIPLPAGLPLMLGGLALCASVGRKVKNT